MNQSILDLLRNYGVRVTAQRAIILEVLSEVRGHHHLTAQEIFGIAQGRLPALNVGTVYRTLEALTDAGLTEQMITGANLVRFSLKDPAHEHCHLSCRRCQRVLEFDSAMMGDVASLVKQRYGFTIDVSHLTMLGICKDCLKGPKKAAVATAADAHTYSHGLHSHSHSHGH